MPTVNDIYQQVLRRPAEPEGLAYWTSIFGDYVDQNELAQFRAAANPELAQRGALPQDLMDRIAASGDTALKIGDTYYQGVYDQATGSGETYNRGPLTNYVSYTDAQNKVGGQYTKYDVTGEKAGTGVQQRVDNSMLPFLLAAGGLALGLPGGGGLLGGASATTGLTAAQIAALTTTDLAIGGGALAGTASTALTAAELAALGTAAVTPAAVAATVTPAATAATTAATALTPAATALTTAQIAQLASAGLSAAQIGSLVSGGLTTASGLLQQQTSREAAVAAQAMIDRETAAAKLGAQFRPIGMTTRFGTSNFAFDPVTGRLIDANYNLSPEAKAQQDRLAALASAGLTQAEGAQAQFAPLQRGAQSLFGLGQGFLDAKTDPRLAEIASQYLTQSPESKRLTALGGDYLTASPESRRLTALGGQYLAQSPEQVAQNYLNQQMALLQPGRELELANLQNRLQQQGRGGLSVAQGGTLGATTPELQALYNARAQQEAQLAAGAQQAGQQQVQFGAGLVGTGQQLGIQGQQFGANLIGSGQQLGIQGQQFGMDTLAKQQALEQQRLAFGSGLFSQGSGLLGQYYGGQQAAYAPYTTAMGQVQNLEQLAQQPFNTSLALAQQQAQAGFNAGQLGLRGAEQSVALATGRAATTNPYSTALGGLAASPAFGQYIGGLFGSTPQASLTAGITPAQIAATEAAYPRLYG